MDLFAIIALMNFKAGDAYLAVDHNRVRIGVFQELQKAKDAVMACLAWSNMPDVVWEVVGKGIWVLIPRKEGEQ